MINYLKGTVTYKNDKSLILENQGIGFKVFCSEKVLEEIKLGQDREIFTFLYFKEERVELYGFLTLEELELFETLKSISGVGPKIALDLSSFGSLASLRVEMEKEDFCRKVKGVGKKRMQKIILELTGKIKEISKKEKEERDEVLETLVSLGFSRREAREVLNKLPKEIEDGEQRVKAALKMIGK